MIKARYIITSSKYVLAVYLYMELHCLMLRSEATNVIREVQNESTSVGFTYTFVYMKNTQTTKLSDLKLEIRLKGALDNIFQFSFWLNFIYKIKIDC